MKSDTPLFDLVYGEMPAIADVQKARSELMQNAHPRMGKRYLCANCGTIWKGNEFNGTACYNCGHNKLDEV